MSLLCNSLRLLQFKFNVSHVDIVLKNYLSMSFFIKKGKPGFKRKNTTAADEKRLTEKKKRSVDDEISSHSEDEYDDSKVYSDVDEDEETEQEKRLRLTKEYIKEIENQGKLLSDSLVGKRNTSTD